jgi:hypothetical protein
VFRNIAVSLIAERFDLAVAYAWDDEMRALGIPLFRTGNATYEETKIINEKNYADVLDGDDPKSRLVIPRDAYFQNAEASERIFAWLRSEDVKKHIVDANPHRHRYGTNNDCFVHVRLGDVARLNPGSAYYIDAISRVPSVEDIYLATDSPEHAVVHEIVTAYPRVVVLSLQEIPTIQFGGTCRYLVLSQGTFSAVTAYTAFSAETIVWPRVKQEWHGDIFSLPGFTCLDW